MKDDLPTPRNRKYAALLPLLGVAQLVLAPRAGRGGWLLGWSGLSWLAVGVAYGAGEPSLLGKTPSGRMRPVNVALLAPYLAVAWGLWFLKTGLTHEAAHTEIRPGLWLGQRPSVHDIPQDITLIVDLTSEFWEPAGVMAGREYLWVPSLDASLPAEQSFLDAVDRILRHEGATLVHCALGRGRSATLVAAVLIARGDVATADEAEAMLKRMRPVVGLNALQHGYLAALVPRLRAISETATG